MARRGDELGEYYGEQFAKGQFSDVTLQLVSANDEKKILKEWHLHKLVLCQSPYFQALFTGGFSQASSPQIQIQQMVHLNPPVCGMPYNKTTPRNTPQRNTATRTLTHCIH